MDLNKQEGNEIGNLLKKLKFFGFNQSKSDPCLFTKSTDSNLLVLLVYIDDILISGTSEEQIEETKAYLHNQFTIKDLGYAKYFLGIELAKSTSSLYLTQRKNVMDILADVRLQDTKFVPFLMQKGHLSKDAGDLMPEPDQY